MSTRIYIETMGCQMNVADTERAESRLKTTGFEIVSDTDSADVVLFNSCSVREKAAQRVFDRVGRVRKQRRSNPPLFGVMGCVAQLEGESILGPGSPISLVIGTRSTDRIPELVSSALGTAEPVIDLGERGSNDRWDVSATDRKSPYVAFVPIVEGCNKFCTYCIVPYSRGREVSRSAEEIVNEVLELKASGYKEVHLIGQNVNSYRPRTELGFGKSAGATPFSRLLRTVAGTGIDRIKFTTSFPRDFHPDIVDAMGEFENLCNWVHLPVQSGSNKILKAMRRGYTVESYLDRVAKVKNSPKRIALTTDIIVGFPGESENDFRDTLELVKRCQYDSLYCFKYSVRKGTPAASLVDDVEDEVKTSRLIELIDLQKGIQRTIFDSYVGQRLAVLAEHPSARSVNDLAGHSTCHKVVNFRGGNELLGRVVDVAITEAKENSLYGVIDHN